MHCMNSQKLVSYCEITGSIFAVVYTLLIASNTGSETLAFSLLLVGTVPFSIWAIVDRKWAFLSLQLFYAASALMGLVRWSS